MNFDKENYLGHLKQVAPGWTDQQRNDYADGMAAKYATIKRGPNVIHLDYFGGMLDGEEIQILEQKLADASLELSRFDKSGVIYGNLQDYTLQIAFSIGPQIITQLAGELVPNIVWDAIKSVVIYTWGKWRGTRKMNGQQQNFGLRLHTPEQATLELKFEGDHSEEVFQKSLDKVLKVIQQKPKRSKHQLSNFFIYDAMQDLWLEIDVMAELRKKAEEQAAARKGNAS